MRLSAAFVIAVTALTATCAPVLSDQAHRLATLNARTWTASPVIDATTAAMSAHGAGEAVAEELGAFEGMGPAGEKLFAAINEFKAAFDAAGGKAKLKHATVSVNLIPEWMPKHPKLRDAMNELRSRLPKYSGHKSIAQALTKIRPELGDMFIKTRALATSTRKAEWYQRLKDTGVNVSALKRKRGEEVTHKVFETPADQKHNVAILLGKRNGIRGRTSSELEAARSLMNTWGLPRDAAGRVMLWAVSEEFRDAYRLASRLLAGEKQMLDRRESSAAKRARNSSSDPRASMTTALDGDTLNAAPDGLASSSTLPHVSSRAFHATPRATTPAPSQLPPASVEHPQQLNTPKKWPLLDLNESPDRSASSPTHS